MKVRYEFTAGIFILAALALFGLSIWILGQERQIFSRQESYYAIFRDIQGLAEGAPVRMGGIAVGRVEKVGFSDNISDPSVKVTLLINEFYLDRISEDSNVGIETQGLLGDKFINITPGTEHNSLPPGSQLRTRKSSDLSQVLSKSGIIIENAVQISDKLNLLLSDLDKTKIKALSEGLQTLADITKQIESGQGLVHRLIYSKKDGDDIIGGLAKASKTVGEISEEMKNGQGLLHALVYGEDGPKTLAAISNAAENLAIASKNIGDVTAEIKTGDGLAHDIIYAKSPEGLAEIIKKLNAAADNIKLASEALANGTGTLGALLVDGKLYDNLVEVTDGAKRSYILRQAIRSSLEK